MTSMLVSIGLLCLAAIVVALMVAHHRGWIAGFREAEKIYKKRIGGP